MTFNGRIFGTFTILLLKRRPNVSPAHAKVLEWADSVNGVFSSKHRHFFQIDEGSGIGEEEDGDDDGYTSPSWRNRAGGDRGRPEVVSTPRLGEDGRRTPSPSTDSPAIVTGRLPNAPPVLQRKLQKLPVVVGKSFRRRVPEDTFSDAEDGGTRSLRLSLRWPNGSVVSDRHSWVKFDERTQTLRLL